MATKQNAVIERIEQFSELYGYGLDRPKGLEIYAAHLFSREEALRSSVLQGESWEEAMLSPYLCGASGDGGFDAILYSSDTDRVIAIQAKYRKDKWQDAELIAELDRFRGSFDLVKNKNLRKDRLSERALELVEDSGLYKPKKSVSLVFVTNQPIGDLKTAMSRCAHISREYEESGLDVAMDLYGAAELAQLEESFDLADSGRVVTAQRIRFGSNKTFEYSTDRRRAIVGFLKGNAVSDLYKEQKDALFNLNVRGFLGGNSINRGIIKTAESEDAENFFYYNNGITATCSLLEDEGKGVYLAHDLQVVNGAQTVRSLHKALKDQPNSKVAVLFRLIETGEANRKKSKFANEIARFQNTQNKVLDSDFFANDKIQVWLENNLASRWSGRGEKNFVSKFHYVRKRGSGVSGAGRAISIQELGKLRHATIHGPKVAYREAKSLWSADDNSRYLEAFGRLEDGEYVAVDQFVDEELAEIAWAIHTWIYVQNEAKLLARGRKDENSRSSKETSDAIPEENYLRNLSFWVVAAAAVGVRHQIEAGHETGYTAIMRSEESWKSSTLFLLNEARINLAREIKKLYDEGQANPRLNLPGNEKIWNAVYAEMRMRGKLK